MENEFKNYEEVMETEDDVIVMEDEATGANGVVKALLTVGGAAVIGTAAWLGKKLWDKNKKRKELRQPDEDEIVEVTDEQIKEVIE